MSELALVWQRLQDLLEKDPVVVVTTIVKEQLLASFSSAKVLIAQATDQVTLGKKQEPLGLGAKRLLVAAWVSTHQGIDPEFALNAVRTLGVDAVVAYNGDVSLLSHDIETAKLEAEARALKALEAGKRVSSVDKKAKAVEAEFALNLHKVADKDPVLVSIDAHIAALVALRDSVLVGA